MYIRHQRSELQPVDAGHPDVEKRDVRARRCVQRGQRRDAVARHRDDLQFGPELSQPLRERCGQVRFVVGDEGGRHVSRSESAGLR
ncbi:hypothetical protein J2785_005994 [Burkholderia ambifaria]|nr:hypothetical protein [Burkholderia ambifaria]